MSLRFEDLTPEQKRQVMGARTKAPKSKRQAPGSSHGTCHACDWTGTASAWEKHSDAEGHHRFDIDLGAAS